MAMWSPWRGCYKYSEGCKNCYIHKGDYKRNIDTSIITKTKQFDDQIRKDINGEYIMKSGQVVYLCFQTDFLLEEADKWRNECWKIIKSRTDLDFIFLTKRIDRFMSCVPTDWEEGYDNVIVGCTIENQKAADYRLPIFSNLPIKHKNIICQPLLEEINIEKYLNGIELVIVGGESDKNGRILEYGWVLKIRQQCIMNKVNFQFRQCSSNFIKDGKQYFLQTKDLCRLARKANIDYKK